ncbi:MAG: gamma carbonic anhydrase family protein [Deltaproteobacteria bacterium]|nr:gamma carbonic anhydrase family protein [Deltaproteobacteria bacterium]
MAHVIPFEGAHPILGRDVYLAPTATVIGNATIGEQSSVWFGAVIRADLLAIVIGARTNIQDNAVVHITNEAPLEGVDSRGARVGTRIGDEVTVGHGAIVHACTIGDRVLVGMGSIILDGAVIGNDVLIAAGSVVPPGSVIPDGVVVMGSPAKVRGPLRESDRFWSHRASQMYVGYADRFRKSGV